MPVTLHDFLHSDRHGGDGVAGYLEPDVRSPDGPHRFVHWRSSHPMLPAFVNCLEGGGDMRRIYTNHEDGPWVRPRGPGVKRRGVLRADGGDGGLTIEPVAMTTRAWPARVAAPAGPGPLPSGGLHAAALASTSAKNATDGATDGGREASVPARALHHYALAARTLIASSAACGFAGSHDHVGAILVDDTGRILAAGINTGSYRHAEVSLLTSWFRDHPRARTLPAKSIVLCTLTPCRQCTRYLTLAKAPDTLIRFDEADAGRSGRAGERIAERIEVEADGEHGPAPDGSISGSSPATAGAVAVREAERRAVRNRGGGDGGPSRIARSREARRVLLEAGERYREGALGGRSVEAAVSIYLADWIRGTSLKSSF